jgi:DNA polymerase-3 subunit alpha
LQGKIPYLIAKNKLKEAEETALKYENIFGKGNFFLELQDHPKVKEQKKVNQALIQLSKKLQIPLVATNDVHYLNPEDSDAQDVLMLINTGSDPNDPERLTMKEDDFSLKTPEKMAEDFKETPEAIENTQKIAEMCTFEFELGKTKLPEFDVPGRKTAEEYLKELCYERIGKKYPKVTDEIKERVEYELSIIKQTGFASYFLIVQDFVNWAKGQRIVVGPGRGSAAGSIVSYILNITNIDPLKYKLLFERFLNPDRAAGLPDIDLDFTDRRRDEVISYVAEKYGKDRVAQIITFGTMAARAVIRDVGRALQYPYSYCDQLAKMIPFGFSLEQTLEQIDEFSQMYKTDEKAKKLIDLAKKLEGVARHASTHACGVVISKDPLDNIVPLQNPTQNEESIVTQYEMHAIEDLGLLKMDFLGLKNLTTIEDTLKMIYAIHKESIDIEKIPLEDKKTFKLLKEGKTVGIFQLESAGMQRYLKQLKPTEMEDVIAMVALYRPGPMQFIPEYIGRKFKKKKIEYLHPDLEPILKNTQGICIYQEQLMQIAQKMAGFTLGEADVLRKAVGKKIQSLLESQKEKFISGMEKNKISKSTASEIWEWVLPFAKYGFNRSHSACYAMIAYQTAYLKSHYPLEFMASLLTSEKADVERISVLIEECEKMGINVLPPDINESFRNFSAVSGENKIRFGLLAIKNVGTNIVESIVKERKESGKFASIEDFILRINSKDLNKKSMESLIKAGAFDELGERNQLLENTEKLLEWSREAQKNKNNGQKGLFDSKKFTTTLILAKADMAKSAEKLKWEKELLGLYITSHPLEQYKAVLEKNTTPISDLLIGGARRSVRVGGIIASLKRIITKTGKPMIFAKLEDMTGKIEVVVFPSIIERDPTLFQENKIVFISGRTDMRDNVPKVVCEDIEELMGE